jgi:phage major head subunit gpT-like protein
MKNARRWNQRTRRIEASMAAPRTLEMQAEFSLKAADGDGPSTPTFELVAYTGAAIRQSWSRNPLVVDLAGMDTSRQSIPILWGHDASLDNVLGQSSNVQSDGKQLFVAGELIGEGPIAERVVSLAKKGLRFQASIGADTGKIENVAPGESVTVNGRNFSGPISVVRGSSLREVSIVLFGADAATSAAIAAEASEDAHMADEAKQTPAEEPVKAVAVEATASVAVEPVVEAKAVEAEAKKEKSMDEIKAEIKAELLGEIRASRPAAPAVHVVEKVDGPAVVEASLALAGGLPNPEKHYDARTLEAAGKARGVSLGEVLLEAARKSGYDGANKITTGNIRQVLAHAFSSHSIGNVVSATYGKFLLAGFTAVESTWDRIASIRSVSDFKAVTGVRLNGGFEFEELAPGGELKSADASDETRTIQAKTYGRISSIRREDIINDDLGALTAVPTRLGRGAALKLNSVFWSEFQSSNSTFYSKETAAAGNALALSSLKTAVTSYRKLKDPDGNPLGIAPSLLLVPPELEITAAELMGSSLIHGTSGAAPSTNVLAGRYQVVSSTYLTSSSTWWLCANPADLPAMEVAFLGGQRVPTVEQADVDFNMLGIQVRGYFDFGVAKGEKNAAYRMATA